MRIEKLSPVMGLEISGVDLADAVDGAAINQALLDGLVICVRDQALEPVPYAEAARLFGEPVEQLRSASRHPECTEVAILASTDKDDLGDGQRLVAGRYWHTDDSYMAIPAKITMLHAIELPSSGGDTRFVNMYAAYDDLDTSLKERAADLRVVHKYESRRRGTRVAARTVYETAVTPDVDHPIVKTHPETGRQALYLNPNRMDHVVGLSAPESDDLLDILIAHATQAAFQYRHRWRNGDLLVWDNRCTMHAATDDYPVDETRVMHRVLLAGGAPL